MADKKDIPKHNGLNVNNDPSHLAERRARQKAEKRRARADGSEASTEEAYKRMEKRQLRTSRES